MYESQDGCTTLLELTRSEAWCEGNSRVRHQFNGITAFVDGSGVYGSDGETAHSLRGTQGKMLTFDGKLPASDSSTDKQGVQRLTRNAVKTVKAQIVNRG